MEEIFIKNRNGLKLSLKLSINENNSKLVFLVHGLGARKEYPPHMVVLEEVFYNNGYNVVNIDTSNSLNSSDQSNLGVTFTGNYTDLEDVIDWAKNQKFFNEPFSLAGQSLGAAATMCYTINHGEKVDLLIPVSLPWINGKTYALENKRRENILRDGYYDQVSKSTGRTLRIYKNYLDDFEMYDFTNKIKKINTPTFLVVGELDNKKYIDVNYNVFDNLKCKKGIFILPNTPHDTANTPETKKLFSETITQILNNFMTKNFD